MKGEYFYKTPQKLFVLFTGLGNFLEKLTNYRVGAYRSETISEWQKTIQEKIDALGWHGPMWFLFELGKIDALVYYYIFGALFPVDLAKIRALFLSNGYSRKKSLDFPNKESLADIIEGEIAGWACFANYKILDLAAIGKQPVQLDLFIKKEGKL